MLFCRHKQLVTRDGQIDEQHLDTESYLKSPSPVPFRGSSVDSDEDGSFFNREDKIPI